MNQPTNADIKESVEVLVHEADSNPSNTELLFAFKEHLAEDTKNFNALHVKMDAILLGQQETMEFMKGVNIGTRFFKFTWNNAAKIGSFILLLIGIGFVIKYTLVGIIAAFWHR